MDTFSFEYKKLDGVEFYSYENSYSEAMLRFKTPDKKVIIVRYVWQNEDGVEIPVELSELLNSNNITLKSDDN